MRVMIDAGAGTLLGDGMGKLVANLRASGYQPEHEDEIHLTHMHLDHLGGSTRDGLAIFPNAVMRVSKQDADFWLRTYRLKQAKVQFKGYIKKVWRRSSFIRSPFTLSRSAATVSFRRASPPTDIRRGTACIR